ncbi:hypothetical protein [Actinoplanes sp. NPDC089786]|uniref:hypothetical protein n=1 Tax=Actinoplanes sp. NPDC089786 TaxID=3155185 RepID=UPI0034303A97
MASRLAAVAVFGGLRQRAWSALVVSSFLVLAAAAAAGPMFTEASGNAAFTARRAAIPVTARQDDSAVVRLSANTRPSSEQAGVLDELRTVPGLEPPRLTGGSIGAELVRGVFWESTVDAGGKPARARLFAVESPAGELVTDRTGGEGLWLPEPVATEIGARAGDTITLTVGLGIDGERKRATAPVAGVYRVDADGRLPADRPGRRVWALRKRDTPGDTEFRTLPAYLLVGDVATVERLAQAVGDQILWSAEAALAPDATLAEARRTAHGVEEMRRRYASAQIDEGQDDPLSLRFASGIGRLAGAAQETTDTVRQRTRPMEWAAIGIGLASVLAVALLTARRRDREVRHAVAVGLPAPVVGGLWLLEHLLPALLGAALGGLAGWRLVAGFGPPGVIAESFGPAAALAGAGTLAGLVTVGGVGALTAARRVRPAPPATARRSLPWGLLVVVAALVAAAGLAGTGGTAGDARGVDLLVPLLVLAAAGVLAGHLPRLLAAFTSPAPRGTALWLARRRLGSGGAERRLAVLVVTTGLGMLLFALSAQQAAAVTGDDRVAVAAGAEGVATLENGSWELDPHPTLVPKAGPDGSPPEGPVPGVRTPPLPAGATLVWRTDSATPLDNGQREALLIDPTGFRDVALWGRGDDLAAARDAVARLAAAPTDPDGTIRAIVVNDPAAAGLNSLRAAVGFDSANLSVIAHVPAFPGLGSKPMYVMAAAPVFAELGPADPRLRPRSGLTGGQVFAQTYVWSSSGAAGLNAVTAPLGVRPQRVETAAVLRQDDVYVATARARGYQLAVAGYLALLAVLTLGVYAQRTAAIRRPADLMLARVGLGRARVLRARALEFVLLGVVGLGAAVAGVLALVPLGPRLLDDQPGLRPGFVFAPAPAAFAVTAAAALLAVVLAVALTAVRSPGAEEEAYRDNG